MILEKLKLIKSFGTSLDSTVTEADIAVKEEELGFPLPEALRELYLTFDPEDPIFSGEEFQLFPLSMLETCQRPRWSDTIVTLLPFCRREKGGFAIEVGQHLKKEPCPPLCPAEDPDICELYLFPETAKEKKYLNCYAVPCNKAKLSQWLVEWMGYEQTLAQPSVVAVNKDKVKDYWKLYNIFSHDFYELPLGNTLCNFRAGYTMDPSPMLYGTILYSQTGYFGAQTDEALENLMKQLGFRYVWIKSQTGHAIYKDAPPKPPQERELLSITPILEFLRDFAGLTRPGTKEESIQRAETRLEAPLPQPMAEFYRYLPSRFYRSYNTIRPLSSLKKAKDGKLNFLEENQAIYHWAAELGSPFVYRRTNNGAGEWVPCGILDGFLAAEFLWAVACDEDSELELWEFPDFEPKMLEPGGLFDTHLRDIAGLSQQVAVGNTRTLYQSEDGSSVLLHDQMEQTLFVLSKDEVAVNRLFTTLGLPTEPVDD